MNNNYTKEMLQKLYENINAAKAGLIDIMPKLKDTRLIANITCLIEGYSQFAKDAESLGHNVNEKNKIGDAIARVGAKFAVEMKTVNDSSSEHISQMIIEETATGITDNISLIRDYENTSCSEKVLTLARSVVNFQERSIEKIKPYL